MTPHILVRRIGDISIKPNESKYFITIDSDLKYELNGVSIEVYCSVPWKEV